MAGRASRGRPPLRRPAGPWRDAGRHARRARGHLL